MRWWIAARRRERRAARLAVWELRQNAIEGQKARDTQCETFPISVKLYEAAERYHFITAGDWQTYRDAAPHGCPPPTDPESP
jgi:hypothetical protein